MVPQIKGAIVETKGTTATIKCNNTGEVWYLTCKGREWIGDFNNCSLRMLTVNLIKVFALCKFKINFILYSFLYFRQYKAWITNNEI